MSPYDPNPRDFRPGQKVWFYGLKAKVGYGFYGIREMYPSWAVPIVINGSVTVTIAHVDDLQRRGKKK